MLVTDRGKIIRMATRSSPIVGRVTQGVKLMDADSEEKVVSVARVVEKGDDLQSWFLKTLAAPPLAVIGAGSPGTALAQLLGEEGLRWTPRPHHAETSPRVPLPGPGTRPRPPRGESFRPRVSFTKISLRPCMGWEQRSWPRPRHVFRGIHKDPRPHLPLIFYCWLATKGIEKETLLTMDGVTREVLNSQRYRLAWRPKICPGSGREAPDRGDHRLP